MRFARIFVVIDLAWLVAASAAIAQVPTATGRQFTLSDPAWKLFIPSTYYQRPDNLADVIVHFHGDPQTYWNNAKYANLNAIIVTVNYNGLSSAYQTPFSNSSLFQSLLDQALTTVRQQSDIPDILQWDKIAVSSFSAGYGAVREILKSSTYRSEISSLLAADSLYATTAADGTPLDSQMVDYETFAGLAKNGTKTFLFSHSQVPTYTYESTQECGDELMQYLGISASPVNTNGLGTLHFYRYAQAGNFRLWGATGTDGDAHLEHLRYIGEFLQDLPLAKVVPGDYNNDGTVNAADYVVWRKKVGPGTLPNDGDVTPGVIDAADYGFWRSRFGATAAAGYGSGGLLAGQIAVPEASAWVMVLSACFAGFCLRVRRCLASAGSSGNTSCDRSSHRQAVRTPALRTRSQPSWIPLLATCVLLLSVRGLRSEPAAKVDVLLQGGTIIDGTGGPSFNGDVGIADGRIVAVGKAPAGTARQTIDCKGLVICPGFIDLHNHSDYTILKPECRNARCYLTQGCTTLVTGNCGGGRADVGKFYDELAEKGTGINIAQLIPQGSVREKVMGNARRAPTDAELKQMLDLADAAMQQGAWGMSTGLQYVPGAFAKTDELVAMAQVVGKRGGFYCSHIRDEGDTLIESIEEVIDVAKGAHLPCHVSHLKSTKRRNWGKVRVAVHVIEQAQRDGLRITADQYPYTASSTSIMAFLLPDREREGGERATADRLKNPEQAKRLRPVIAEALDARGRIMIASYETNPEWVGKDIADIAKQERREPVDVALHVLRNDPDADGVNFSMDEADVRFVMALPWVATASDGSSKIDDGTHPHPRSFGTFPRKIGRYSIREHVIPLPAAIRSATGLPADILGMTDRGYVREKLVADVVVFDPKQFIDRATYERPFEPSVGVRWLFLNGRTVIADGVPQDVLAGKPLRHLPRTSSAGNW